MCRLAVWERTEFLVFSLGYIKEKHHKGGLILTLVASSDMDCCSTSPDRRAGIRSKSKSDHFAFHSNTNITGMESLN